MADLDAFFRERDERKAAGGKKCVEKTSAKTSSTTPEHKEGDTWGSYEAMKPAPRLANREVGNLKTVEEEGTSGKDVKREHRAVFATRLAWAEHHNRDNSNNDRDLMVGSHRHYPTIAETVHGIETRQPKVPQAPPEAPQSNAFSALTMSEEEGGSSHPMEKTSSHEETCPDDTSTSTTTPQQEESNPNDSIPVKKGPTKKSKPKTQEDEEIDAILKELESIGDTTTPNKQPAQRAGEKKGKKKKKGKRR